MKSYRFLPNIYTINKNQIIGILQALQINFPEDTYKSLPKDLAQHFVLLPEGEEAIGEVLNEEQVEAIEQEMEEVVPQEASEAHDPTDVYA